MVRWNTIWILLAFVLLGCSFYFRYRADLANDKLQEVEQINHQLQQAQSILRQQIALIKDRDTKIVSLTDGVPKVVTLIYHNIVRGETALDISGIPQPPEGQYIQAWAIVDNKPVSLGMVSLTATGSWFPLPFLREAEGFIISQEQQKEGNDRPIIELMNGRL